MVCTWQNWKRSNKQASTVIPCRENSALFLSLSVDLDFFYFPSGSFILLWDHFCLGLRHFQEGIHGVCRACFFFPTRWGQRVWDSPGPAGAGPDPSLHAVPRCSRGRSGDPVPARGPARDLWQETLSARKHRPSLAQFTHSTRWPLFCPHSLVALIMDRAAAVP